MRRSDGGLALLAGTTLFVAMYGARVLHSGSSTFGFLLWNLMLAWAPWLFARAAAGAASRGFPIAAWSLGAAWLLFLPNAPYLVTDFVHLRPRAGVPLWYDIALLGTAALTGLVAGGFSLRAMHAWIAERHGPLAGWLLLSASVPATGLGIYLGRFERHNSWDLILRPDAVLSDVFALVIDPSPRALVVTAVFAALTAVAYLAAGGRVTPSEARQRA